MADAFQTIKDLEDIDVPKKLAKKTLNKIFILKLRPYIYAFTAIMLANFVWLAIHIYSYLASSEALTVIKVMLGDFDLSSDYILNSLAGLREILPLYRLSMLALNFFLILCLSLIFQRYRHELLRFSKNY